jgi:hypothetical protein
MGREPIARQITACECVGTNLNGAQLVRHFVFRSFGYCCSESYGCTAPKPRLCAQRLHIGEKRTFARYAHRDLGISGSKNGPTWEDVQ